MRKKFGSLRRLEGAEEKIRSGLETERIRKLFKTKGSVDLLALLAKEGEMTFSSIWKGYRPIRSQKTLKKTLDVFIDEGLVKKRRDKDKRIFKYKLTGKGKDVKKYLEFLIERLSSVHQFAILDYLPMRYRTPTDWSEIQWIDLCEFIVSKRVETDKQVSKKYGVPVKWLWNPLPDEYLRDCVDFVKKLTRLYKRNRVVEKRRKELIGFLNFRIRQIKNLCNFKSENDVVDNWVILFASLHDFPVTIGDKWSKLEEIQSKYQKMIEELSR